MGSGIEKVGQDCYIGIFETFVLSANFEDSCKVETYSSDNAGSVHSSRGCQGSRPFKKDENRGESARYTWRNVL